MRVEERLLKYVSYWTTSDEECRQIPSSERQFELGKVLEQELRDLGLEKVTLTDHCYVYGLLPATKGYADKPAVGFISHMDTAPDFSGKDVKPQIIPDYDGNDVLLKGSGAYLKVSDFPTLKTLKGRTLITTDGTTLLGADDKAGVSEIMTAVEQIITEKIPHGDIWIGFTPDEEVGSGADLFDLGYFKARFAYTVDGDYEGEVAYENFNAASASFEINGVNVHPGVGDDDAVEGDCAGGRLLQQVQTPQEGGLSGAGGPDDADHVPPVDLRGDALEHLGAVEALAQVFNAYHSSPASSRICPGPRSAAPRWQGR